MSTPKRFLIPDGYSRESRAQFADVGMREAGILYRDMALDSLPDARCDLWYVSEEARPEAETVAAYDAILWPGCNRTVYHDEPEVRAMIEVTRAAYDAGVPQFGSCWGLQIAAFAAGGTVGPHPRGREMGIGRNLCLSDEARRHPMMEGKPQVFCAFMSHDDYVSALPPGAVVLAGNDWCPIQAAEIRHGNGVFWSVQYHPEYDLRELARLILAREERLIRQGLFRDHEDLAAYSDKLEALHRDPGRPDLRWQLGIGDDVIDPGIRRREFRNFLTCLVDATVPDCDPA